MLRFFSIPFFSVSLLLFLATACKTENKALTAYKNHTFDTAVINRLPLYDSLALAILEKMPLINQHIHADNAYHAFRFMPASGEAEVFKKLPADLGSDIDRHYSKLGTNFIYAFDVFKDSTIKIYVRKRTLDTKVDIQENISYHPSGKNIQTREYPAKDSILNKHWQYWVRFDNPGFF